MTQPKATGPSYLSALAVSVAVTLWFMWGSWRTTDAIPFLLAFAFVLAVVFAISAVITASLWRHSAQGRAAMAEQQRLAQVEAELAEAQRIIGLRQFVVQQYRSYTGNPNAMLTDAQVAALMREADHSAAVQSQLAAIQQGQAVQTALVFGALGSINSQIAHQNHQPHIPEPQVGIAGGVGHPPYWW